jgi:CheY-like chemotaxis protein
MNVTTPHERNAATVSSLALNVLLVDDDDICVFIHRKVLGLSGHCKTTESAPNGKAALETLQRAATGACPPPDLILLDLHMPVMDGMAFLEAFQSMDFPGKDRIAIVLLTSSVWDSDKTYAISLGAAHYLQKPFTTESFEYLIGLLYKKQIPPAFTGHTR